MNTGSSTPIFIIVVIPYSKNCSFFKNFKKPHPTPHIPKSPTQTSPKRSDQDMIVESSLDPVCSLNVPNCNPVDLLALSTENH